MQFDYDDTWWLVDFCQHLYRQRGYNPIPLYNRLLAAACDLCPPAVHNRLSLRQQQDRLYSLTWDELDELRRRATAKRDAEESQDLRVAFAASLLHHGANPNEAERTYRASMPVLDLNIRDRLVYCTPLQLAARSGFTRMVRVLLGRGADCNKIGRGPTADPQHFADSPLMLAIDRSQPDGNLETLRLLLNAGASLRGDDNGTSVLEYLREKESFGYHREPLTAMVELLLRHDAATPLTDDQWAAFVTVACTPGNGRLCKLLKAAHTFDTFQPATLIAMADRVAFPPGEAEEDPVLLVWVLWDCWYVRGFMDSPLLIRWAERAEADGRNKIARALRVFVTMQQYLSR